MKGKKEMDITIEVKDIINVNENKYYIEIDGIRLIVEDGKLSGWYRPDI